MELLPNWTDRFTDGLLVFPSTAVDCPLADKCWSTWSQIAWHYVLLSFSI